jgi:hypothetical protein
VPSGDAALAAAFHHLMHGDDLARLEDAQLMGQAVCLDDAAESGIVHAVEIAVDRDHAIAGDPPFQSQHCLKRPGREGLQFEALFGEVLGDDLPGGGVSANI